MSLNYKGFTLLITDNFSSFKSKSDNVQIVNANESEFKAFIHQNLFTLQKVEVGLQLQALKLLCDATRKADEELQSYTQDCVESSSIIETYMALANFCDKRLREEEQSDTGE